MIRDWHDGYLCRGMNEILAIIRLIDPRAFPCEGRNIFRGKPPFTTRFRIFRSSRMESCVAQKCRHFSRRTTSVPLSWMARARHASRPSRVETALSSKRGGERRETIKSDEGRGEGEKRERKKRKKERKRRDYFLGEGKGNSKAARISSAFAWKYAVDRIFQARIQTSPPSSPLLSRFIIFRLYHLPASNHHRGN